MADPLYLVAYDIAEPRRWRKVYRLLQGYGEWVQLSVFQCRLDAARRRRLEAELALLIRPRQDRVLIARVGAGAGRAVQSLGPPVIPPRPSPLIL
jgi:CRISPR-associated protein Cas2